MIWPPGGKRPASNFPNYRDPGRTPGDTKTLINFRVDAAMLAAITQVGVSANLNLSDTCRLLLREALAARTTKGRKT